MIFWEIARYTNFCLEVLESGRHPFQGFYGEKFEPKSKRLERAGKELAGPWVGCFAGNKADNKSRHEFNFFKQWYQCTLMCDECCAQAPRKHANLSLVFGNFDEDAPWVRTMISPAAYLMNETDPSPQTQIKGWNTSLKFRDDMQNLYAQGFCSDVIANPIADALFDGLLGYGLDDNMILKILTAEFKKWCKDYRIPVSSSQGSHSEL